MAFAAAAAAQDLPAQTEPTASERPKRDYSGTIQMHESPLNISVPDPTLDPQESMTDSLGLSTEESVRSAPPPPPARTRRPTQDEMDRSKKNWILPPTPDGKPRETKDGKPSGWGWLADEVRDSQKQQDKTEEESDEAKPKGKEEDDGRKDPAARKERPDPNDDNKKRELLLKFEPVSTEGAKGDSRKRDGSDSAASDRRAGAQDEPEQNDGSAAGENRDGNARESETRDQRSGADSLWGNEGMWDRDRKPDNALPQTAALLSTKPGNQPSDSPSTPDRFEATMLKPVLPDSSRAAAPEASSPSALQAPVWSDIKPPALPSRDSYTPSLSAPRNPYESPLSSRSLSTPLQPSAFTPSPTLPANTSPALKDPWAIQPAP